MAASAPSLHDASAASPKKISATSGDFSGTLDELDMYGWAVEAIGDLDGDSDLDIAASTSDPIGEMFVVSSSLIVVTMPSRILSRDVDEFVLNIENF